MTEDEAKKKWCPFARVAGKIVNQNNDVIGYASQNRGLQMDQPIINCYCVTTKCMMWKKDVAASQAQGQKIGYCGLAR